MKSLLPALLLTATATVSAMPPQGGMQVDMGEMFLKQYDSNKDGAVSLQEYTKPTEQQFSYMDTNKDGKISGDEASAFAQEMQQKMRQMRQQHGGGPGK